MFLGLVVLVAIASLLAYHQSNRSLKQSDAYRDGLSIASSSAELQNILGSNIHPISPPIGHAARLWGSEFTEWSVVIGGTSATGRLYGVANQVNGVRDYSRLVFKSADGKQQVSLAPVHQLSLPRVPSKRLYLVPMGLAEGESIDWAPAYYRSKLGADVVLLPPVSLPSQLINKRRNQLDAYKCLHEFLQEEYPQIANDPSAVILVVTSKDMYISILDWSYAENYRAEGRFAVVSSVKLHLFAFLEKMNPEWFTSRLQKLMTKNIVMLYFDLPMSSDYTSLLSGGVLPGWEIDYMGPDIIGSQGRWDPFIESGAPAVTIYDVPGKPSIWNRKWANSPIADPASQVFTVSLDIGLLVQRKADFVFPGEPAMQFTRSYRNQDDRSRAFGIGGSHSFDMFLGGKMGVAVDLIMPDGHRVHFKHAHGETYLPTPDSYGQYVDAVYVAGTWKVRSADGWTYLFPYRQNALPQYVTVLTRFLDPAQREYEMQRDSFGALLEVKSPSGVWLHFENDSEHRIRRITASSGRSVTYDYDSVGNMIRAEASDGSIDSYRYDDKAQMLSAAHGQDKPFLVNEYFVDGYIKAQTTVDGQTFRYRYSREGGRILNTYITDPNGLETYVEFQSDGYLEWIPAPAGR